MSQESPYNSEQVRQENATATRDFQQTAVSTLSTAESSMSDVTASVAVLRTQADNTRGLLGFGRRILVPPDEIHVVVGNGRHAWTMSNERNVFGQSAKQPAKYWLNTHTQVIKLKTISFTVAVHGASNGGVQALDSSKVSFRLWAHAVAKLNPEKAETAAQRVGLDTGGLIYTITKVGTAELVSAAASKTLEEVIANRQGLAEIAFPKVNQILSELGYDLALLTITKLDGNAYKKLIQQAESRISKETGIATNKEQLAELTDMQAREQREAEVGAQTEKKLASERLNAQQVVETATISQQEALDIKRHEMLLKQIDRQKAANETEHEADLVKVQLAQQIGVAEAKKEANLAQLQTERQAELRAIQQERTAKIQLAQTEAEAARMAVAQAKEIERKAALTQAEAARLDQEELALAERTKEVALVEAQQLAEALKLEASAEANALQIKVDAQTKMELVKAEAEATATEKRAHAAKIRAQATKAETAASGLAEAEVEAARVSVSEQRVAVTRAEGLAQAEVAQALAVAEAEKLERLKAVEINAQKELALLYEQAPILVDLEKMRMQLNHEEKIATIQAETSLKAFEAIAPGIKVNIFGNGGQTGQLLSNVMALSHGLNQIGDEIPFVSNLLNGSQGDGESTSVSRQQLAQWTPRLAQFLPYIQQLVGEMNPRVLSSLKVADVVERLGPVVAGQENLVTALSNIKEDATFRVIGDMPISPILRILGLENGNGTIIEEIEVQES